MILLKKDNIKLSNNFTSQEFNCKCGQCQITLINPKLIKMLQELRELINKPLIINSGYRCEQHNNRVSRSKLSTHQDGSAVDIRLIGFASDGPIGFTADELIAAAVKVGFKSIGVADTFIHLDTRDEFRRWTY